MGQSLSHEEQSRREAARDASPFNHEQAAQSLGLATSTYKSWLSRNRPEQLIASINDNEQKILFLDIETRPAVAYVWQLFDVTVALNQVVDPGGTICFGAKWAGDKRMIFYSDWQHGHAEMIAQAHKLFSEADAIITYNGDRFDIPKLRGEFLLANLPPPPPLTSIDVYKAVKKHGLLSNKLAFVGPLLTDEEKLKHEGMELWTKVLHGDRAAQRKMQRYCSQDVLLLEKVYDRIRPYIANHPHLGMTGAHQCGNCGSHRTEAAGIRRTKASFITRVRCQACGAWQDGKKVRAA